MSIDTKPLGGVATTLTCNAGYCRNQVTESGAREWGATGSRAKAEQRAQNEGWSCWLGRSARHYCGSHTPNPGHKMRLLWGPS